MISLPIAFIIMAHGDEVQLRRLVCRLRPHRIFIHWDAKAGAPPSIDNVTFVKPRYPVYWAGYSQVNATIALMKAVIADGAKYSKVMLLSGSCYPIRPVADLHRKFMLDGGANYINAVRVADSPHLTRMVSDVRFRDSLMPWQLSERLLNYKAEKVLRKGIEAFCKFLPTKKGYIAPLYHGSTWWALTPETVKYILEFIDNHLEIVNFYRRTFAADEQIFHTIVHNSDEHVNGAQVHSYQGRGVYRTANLHIIDPSLSKWYEYRDLAEIETSDMFFVRKVKSLLSDKLLDALDERMSPGARFMSADAERSRN